MIKSVPVRLFSHFIHSIIPELRNALALVLLLSVSTLVFADEESLPPVDLKSLQDLSMAGETGQLDGRPLMLAFVADYCHYCEVVKEEFFKPMLRNRDYDSKVIIRVLDISGGGSLTGFDGQSVTVEDLVDRYNVMVTPTVVFLGQDGTELAPRLIGVSNVEFYGGFLDDAIETALTQTKLASSSSPIKINRP